jgi:hypothetical protein
MQFFFFDVGATLVFLLGYAAVLALRQRQPVRVTAGRGPSSPEPLTPARECKSDRANGQEGDRSHAPRPEPRREWPRLIYPR